MITKQHALLTLLVLLDINNEDYNKSLTEFREAIPFILMPDAIRCYTGSRSISHFGSRYSLDEDGKPSFNGLCDSIVFPTLEKLNLLNKDNVKEICHVKYSTDSLTADVDDTTNLSVFEKLNVNHPYYKFIKAHLMQDIVMDYIFREYMVDVSNRYVGDKGGVYFAKINGEEISISDMRKNLYAFEESAFMSLAKRFYQITGKYCDREWFDTNVYEVLKQKTPEFYCECTYKYMFISAEDERKMHSGIWTSNETKESLFFTQSVEKYDDLLKNMFSSAYYFTKSVLV